MFKLLLLEPPRWVEAIGRHGDPASAGPWLPGLDSAATAWESEGEMTTKGAEETRQRAATPAALSKRLQPRLAKWFGENFADFTHPQLLAVPAILDRESIMITSPTGSGKTLAGFLGVFDGLLRKLDEQGQARTSQRDVPTKVQCIYVSPLCALAYDIGKNVRAPLVGMGLEKKLRIHLRTGDKPSAERVKFRERAAHILITAASALGSR